MTRKRRPPEGARLNCSGFESNLSVGVRTRTEDRTSFDEEHRHPLAGIAAVEEHPLFGGGAASALASAPTWLYGRERCAISRGHLKSVRPVTSAVSRCPSR